MPKQKSKFTPEYIRQHKEEHAKLLEQIRNNDYKNLPDNRKSIRLVISDILNSRIKNLISSINEYSGPEFLERLYGIKNIFRNRFQDRFIGKEFSRFLEFELNKKINNLLLIEIRKHIEILKRNISKRQLDSLKRMFNTDPEEIKSICKSAKEVLEELGLTSKLDLNHIVKHFDNPLDALFNKISNLGGLENISNFLKKITEITTTRNSRAIIDLFKMTKTLGISKNKQIRIYDKYELYATTIHEYIHTILEENNLKELNKKEGFVEALTHFILYKLNPGDMPIRYLEFATIDMKTPLPRDLIREYNVGAIIGTKLALYVKNGNSMDFKKFVDSYKSLEKFYIKLIQEQFAKDLWSLD